MRTSLVLPCLLVLAACGDDPASSADDAGRDVPALDATDASADATDDTRSDAASDTTADTTTDALSDTTTDAAVSSDAVSSDVSADTGADTGVDTGDDTSTDAPSDVTSDAAADVADTTADVAPDTAPDVEPSGPCDYATPVAEDADRIVLVGHTNTDVPTEPGTDVRLMVLRADGTLEDVGFRLDVGFRPERIELMPSGEMALVVGERGETATVAVTKTGLALVDSMTITAFGVSDVRLAADEGLAFLLSHDSSATGGIHTVRIGCDGTLSSDGDLLPLRLSSTLDYLPGDRAVVLGGQALWDHPERDVNDMRLLAREGDSWREIAGFDIWGDFTDALRMSTSPDGAYAIVPNGSPFSDDGNQIALVSINGDTITERQRVLEMNDVREAYFSTDGRSAFATLFEPGQVVVFSFIGGTLTETERFSGIGLVDTAAVVRRGPLTDRVLMASTDTSGISNVAMMQLDGDGDATYIGQVDFGDGIAQIPGPIAVVP